MTSGADVGAPGRPLKGRPPLPPTLPSLPWTARAVRRRRPSRSPGPKRPAWRSIAVTKPDRPGSARLRRGRRGCGVRRLEPVAPRIRVGAGLRPGRVPERSGGPVGAADGPAQRRPRPGTRLPTSTRSRRTGTGRFERFTATGCCQVASGGAGSVGPVLSEPGVRPDTHFPRSGPRTGARGGHSAVISSGLDTAVEPRGGEDTPAHMLKDAGHAGRPPSRRRPARTPIRASQDLGSPAAQTAAHPPGALRQPLAQGPKPRCASRPLFPFATRFTSG